MIVILHVNGAETFNGNKVQLYECNGTNAQKFVLVEDNEGRFEFLSKCSTSFALDLDGGNTENGNKIQLWNRNGTLAQKFYVKLA